MENRGQVCLEINTLPAAVLGPVEWCQGPQSLISSDCGGLYSGL